VSGNLLDFRLQDSGGIQLADLYGYNIYRAFRQRDLSFMNALVATLMAHHPKDFSARVRFANCDPLIRQMILSAIALGRRESTQHA